MMNTETTAVSGTSAFGYLIGNYAQYNLWANATLIYWLKSKSPDVWEATATSSFPSIRETLLHMLNTQSYWFSVFSGQPGQSWSQDLDSMEVFEYLIDQSAAMAEFLESAPTIALTGRTLVENPWFECDFQNFEYVMQCINHSTYHRGQVVTIGRQLGLTDAPNTDYNYYNVRGK